jgi:hypothetical protein
MRILLTNDPRAYRETIAATLQALRPHLTVVTAEPECLDAAVREHVPQLVVCSRLTELVQTRLLAWVLLHPDNTAMVRTSLAGRATTVAGLDLAGLLDFIDRTECQACPSGDCYRI